MILALLFLILFIGSILILRQRVQVRMLYTDRFSFELHSVILSLILTDRGTGGNSILPLPFYSSLLKRSIMLLRGSYLEVKQLDLFGNEDTPSVLPLSYLKYAVACSLIGYVFDSSLGIYIHEGAFIKDENKNERLRIDFDTRLHRILFTSSLLLFDLIIIKLKGRVKNVGNKNE